MTQSATRCHMLLKGITKADEWKIIRAINSNILFLIEISWLKH